MEQKRQARRRRFDAYERLWNQLSSGYRPAPRQLLQRVLQPRVCPRDRSRRTSDPEREDAYARFAAAQHAAHFHGDQKLALERVFFERFA
jgi:hypothetical protein